MRSFSAGSRCLRISALFHHSKDFSSKYSQAPEPTSPHRAPTLSSNRGDHVFWFNLLLKMHKVHLSRAGHMTHACPMLLISNGKTRLGCHGNVRCCVLLLWLPARIIVSYQQSLKIDEVIGLVFNPGTKLDFINCLQMFLSLQFSHRQLSSTPTGRSQSHDRIQPESWMLLPSNNVSRINTVFADSGHEQVIIASLQPWESFGKFQDE